MSFNKMVLLSEDRLAALTREGGNAHVAAAIATTPKTPLQLKEDELRTILADTSIADDHKLHRYNDVLRQLVALLHPRHREPPKDVPVKQQQQHDTPPAVTRERKHAVGEDANEVEPATAAVQQEEEEDDVMDDALEYVAPEAPPPATASQHTSAQDKERLLRAHLASQPLIFGEGANGELVIRGYTIDSSNLEELIADFSNPYRWKSHAPTGATRFAAYLRNTGFDREHIANRTRRWQDQEGQGRNTDMFSVARWTR